MLGPTPPTLKSDDVEGVSDEEVFFLCISLSISRSECEGIYMETYCFLMCLLAGGRLVTSDTGVGVA